MNSQPIAAVQALDHDDPIHPKVMTILCKHLHPHASRRPT